jgi:enoyl-CoA hydratase/carnithine racemase
MSETYQHIGCVLDDGILEVVLNRPDKLNAYTATMGAELAHAFRRADADDAVRVVLVTGAGRAFCAGADISAGAGAFDTTSPEGSSSFGEVSEGGRSAGAGFVGAIYECRKPSIAAFNGAAVGVGLTLTLPMDIPLRGVVSYRKPAAPGSCPASSACPKLCAGAWMERSSQLKKR